MDCWKNQRSSTKFLQILHYVYSGVSAILAFFWSRLASFFWRNFFSLSVNISHVFWPFSLTNQLNLCAKPYEPKIQIKKIFFPFRAIRSASSNLCAAKVPHLISDPIKRVSKIREMNGAKHHWLTNRHACLFIFGFFFVLLREAVNKKIHPWHWVN